MGLITVANLNCRQVKTYLFSLISELEIRLSNLLDNRISDEDLYDQFFSGEVKDKHTELKKRFDKDKSEGVDARLVEYLYLSDLVYAAKKTGVNKSLGYTNKKFENALGSTIDLRHAVTHPTRKTLKAGALASQLWNRIDLIEEILFRLCRVNQETISVDD